MIYDFFLSRKKKKTLEFVDMLKERSEEVRKNSRILIPFEDM
jgi:hypothetical protein